MPGQTRSRNSLFEVALLILICGLLTWFVVLPKKAEVDAKQKELDQVKQTQSQVADNLASLQKLAADLKSHPTEVSELDQALPLDGRNINIQLLLQDLAQSSGVTVSDISMGGSAGIIAGDKTLLSNFYGATRKLQKMSGNVKVIGTFSQLETFLHKVEDSGRLMDINQLSIDPASDGNLNMSLTLNAYYYAP